MGGIGGGRQWGGQRKGRSEQYPGLDVRRLQRHGLLLPGQSFQYHWRRKRERAATINLTALENRVVLRHEHLLSSPVWNREEYTVQLEWLPCNYGGRRAWFRCPVSGCGRRVAILYGNGIFACRNCHRLAYSSQRIQPWDRALRRAQAIRQRLS